MLKEAKDKIEKGSKLVGIILAVVMIITMAIIVCKFVFSFSGFIVIIMISTLINWIKKLC